MKLRRILGAALALLVVARGAALAQESSVPASFARTDFGSRFTFRDEIAPIAHSTWAAPVPALSGARAAHRLEAVHYQPRSHGHSGGYGHGAPVQLHAGFFEPGGGGPTRFAFGFRGGPAVDEHIQLGIGIDWYHQSEDQSEVVGQSFQGGQPITVTRTLARASSDLLPFQAYVQVGGGGRLPLIPYVGVAGQYQVLFLSATDYQTGADFGATFGGWGWQAWGGAALPLSGQSRLFGEAFYNAGDVERDVLDTASGVTYREVVDADGVGMRFGLSWGF